MELALGCGWKWERGECGPQLMTNESKLEVNYELGLCLEMTAVSVDGQCWAGCGRSKPKPRQSVNWTWFGGGQVNICVDQRLI